MAKSIKFTPSEGNENIKFVDTSQERVFNISQAGGAGTYRTHSNFVANPTSVQESGTAKSQIKRSIEIDMEVANLIDWLAEQQGIAPEVALKKTVATAAYLYDITASKGGKLLVQRKDNSVGEIVLK